MGTNKNKWVYGVFIACVVVLSLEFGAGHAIGKSEDMTGLRKALIHPNSEKDLPLLSEQAYLNYICTPGYAPDGIPDHNEDGYRGARLVPSSTDGIFRILFLGGSTTYSIAAGSAGEAFPGQVENALNNLDASQTIMGGRKLEVLNGGLPFGTSAELLTHYLFKYRYYHPDLVVVHAGGNDAFSYIMNQENYQPDYNHWRGSFKDPPMKSMAVRILMRSRFVSLALMKTVLKPFIQGKHYVHSGQHAVAYWHTEGPKANKLTNAFYNNLQTLIQAVLSDSSDVVLIPFLYNSSSQSFPNSEAAYIDGIASHRNWMQELSAAYGIGFVELSETIIKDNSLWIDDCHLLPNGIKTKAEYSAIGILNYLSGK